MTRLIIAATACVAILLGIGLFAQDRLFGSAPTATLQPIASAEPALAAPAKPPEQPARVTHLAGNVEVYHPKEGRWRELKADELLGEDAVLRTTNGELTLGIGPSIEVEVGSNSQFRIKELTAQLSKVDLEQGLVTANVSSHGQAELAVGVLGSEVEARASDGKFSVLRDQQGQVTVAGHRGHVSVDSHGTKVTVESGQQSTVAPGAAPTPPIQIPGSLIVKLTRGHVRKLRYRSTVVEGETSPGAIVVVNGVETRTVNGRFSAMVPLNEGTNTVTVVSRDVLGREATQVVRGIEVDSRPPAAEGHVSW
jgi:hypothetical protein